MIKQDVPEFDALLKTMGFTPDGFHDMMTCLDELSTLMKDKSQGGENLGYCLDRYNGMCQSSEFGRDCGYAKKAAFYYIKDGSHDKLIKCLKKIAKQEWLKKE